MGMIFAPAFGTATLNVPRNEAGVASAMVNTSQQVGGSVGTSLLSTLFASSAAAFARSHTGTAHLQAAALVHGYTTAFWWASGIFAVGLIIALTVFPRRIKDDLVAGGSEPAGSEVSLATD
jgi:sugar phosphate permease